MFSALGAFDRALKIVAEIPDTIPDATRFKPLVRASVLLARGDLTEAESDFGSLSHEQISSPYATGNLPIYGIMRGAYHLAKAEYEKAYNATGAALAAAERARIMPFRVPLISLRAQACLALGRTEEAWQMLEDARHVIEHLGLRFRAWDALLPLAALEEERGRPELAAAHRQAAQEAFAYVIAHIDDPELRASFLNQRPLEPAMDLAHPPN